MQHTDGLGNITQWDYDVLGRLKVIVYPGSARHSYLEYDGHGNLLSERTPNGVLITHGYDARNRRTETTYAGAGTSAVEQFSYDGNNNLLSVQEQSEGGTPVTSEYSYDRFDRLTRYQSPFGETVTYSYDANGNRTALISSGGHASRYSYDPRNRLSSVSNRDGETTYSWRRNDQLSRIRYSHGGSSRYEYDGANRLTGLTHQAFGGDVARYAYSYDANGNRTQQVEENGQGEQVTTYSYDSADRLTGVTYPDQQASYSYDAAWNRISETLRDLTENTLISDKTLGYNSRNQLTSVQDSQNLALNATYSYDANGNQTGKTQGGSTTDYTFGARNHLRSITTDGNPVGSFLYDYRGLRIQKQAPGIIRYTHDDQAVLFQSDASGSVTHRFEYGPDRLLSLKPATQASEFYLLDALNSPVALVRGDGTLTARYSYDAWGNKRQDTGTSSNPFGFTGHEHDSETGLIYAKARYYDPETARFLSQDPWAGDATMPPSLNKYLYAYQNPTVYVDPDGQQTICRSTAADGSTVFADCGAHGGAETQIVRDPGGEEAARRRALEERTAALQATRRAAEEGERVRQVGTNALCGTNSAPAHCVQGLPPRQVTVAESDVAPDVVGIEDIEQQIRADHERMAELAAVIGPGLGILEVAMPGRAASGTAGKAAGEIAEGAASALRRGIPKGAGKADSAPDFVVSPGGTAFPVPKGATGPTPVVNPAGKKTGDAFTGGSGGANGQVDTMRMMDPTPPRGNSPGYPNGYIKYENKAGQGVDPYTGRTLSNKDSHFPID